MVSTGGSVPRIRQLREQRGWTQQGLAQQVAQLAWLRTRERVGVNADMIAKWERGAKGVSPRYQDLLSLLFGVPAGALGISPRPPSTDHLIASDSEAVLVSTLGEAADLLHQLGSAGAVLQFKMFEIWKDEIMRRRAFLKLMSLGPAVASSEQQAAAAVPARPTPDTLRLLDELADRFQRLYHSTAPAVLLMPIVAHLATVGDLLRQTPGPHIRRTLLANRARVGTLAGRLAFFDLQDPMAARAYYNLALEAAQEGSDHHQAAAVLGHIAFIPASDHGFAAALDYLRGANQYLQRRPHGALSSWLSAVESEVHTNVGLHPAALSAIDKARDALAVPRVRDEPAWFDYYGEARLAGFAGYANLRAGRLPEARNALMQALGHLPPMAVKQRAVFLTDLAAVHHKNGDLDEACRTAGDAADQLHLAGYATGSGRLRDFRATVEPWKSSRPVRALDDQLATIA